MERDKKKKKKNRKSSINRPFKIGEGVRTRLTATERNKRSGKKMADLKSKRFIIAERHNNTNKLKDEKNPTSRAKERHFNEIKPTPQHILS